jgi:uncharacterized protein YndB with AHSA1/START domain
MSQLQARNETIIDAPISRVWSIITDINLLHKVNPGVIKATGAMNQLNGTRTCEMNNRGKMGTMTERLVELIPEKKTAWSIENDSMGMKKMIKDSKFCFELEKIDDNRTRVRNESYYKPANFMVSIMNALMMKRMMSKIQGQILANLKTLAEK